MAAGYSWVLGWAFEMAWQLSFQLQSPLGMWICVALILGALASFGRALLRLYRCASDTGMASGSTSSGFRAARLFHAGTCTCCTDRRCAMHLRWKGTCKSGTALGRCAVALGSAPVSLH